MNAFLKWFSPLLFAAGAFALPPRHVGKLPDGGFLLNTGWTIRPAGDQVPVDTLPMSTALSADGKYLLVLNAGYHPPSVSVIDVAGKREVSRFKLPDAWLGLTVASGNRVFVGGATGAVVYELALDAATGTLTKTRELPAVADLDKKGKSFIGDVLVRSDGRVLYAADLEENNVAVIDLDTGKLLGRFACGRRPYRLLLSPDDKTLLVSSWADGTVYRYDANHGNELSRTRVAPSLTDMIWLNQPPISEGPEAPSYVARVFVAAGNTNNVYALGVGTDGELSRLESINLSLTPMHPLGMTPTALAVDKQGTHLYVVCSDANAVAAVNIAGPRSIVAGFVPTGWYPTAVRELPDHRVVILNGKGEAQTGTVSFVPELNAANLRQYTATVLRNSPYRDDSIYGPPANEQTAYFSSSQGHRSPIEHVIYVIDGSRSDGQATPNLHRLASDFVRYDNFYLNSAVSAEAQNWATAAIAPDYTVKLAPNSDAGRRQAADYQGGEPANLPPAGYLWSNAQQAGITFRDYGEWTTNIPLDQVKGPSQIASLKDRSLTGHVDMNYRGFDASYPDVKRVQEFVREWKDFDAAGQAPQLTILSLGSGQAADNDAAIGQLVDAVSHSKLWASTAIFIAPDSARDGRAPAWVISPYTRRGTVDSGMYNQTSVLRTIELILGLKPMTQFDAASPPMFGSFSRQPDLKPYAGMNP